MEEVMSESAKLPGRRVVHEVGAREVSWWSKSWVPDDYVDRLSQVPGTHGLEDTAAEGRSFAGKRDLGPPAAAPSFGWR